MRYGLSRFPCVYDDFNVYSHIHAETTAYEAQTQSAEGNGAANLITPLQRKTQGPGRKIKTKQA
jgi:hypothetical protein